MGHEKIYHTCENVYKVFKSSLKKKESRTTGEDFDSWKI